MAGSNQTGLRRLALHQLMQTAEPLNRRPQNRSQRRVAAKHLKALKAKGRNKGGTK